MHKFVIIFSFQQKQIFSQEETHNHRLHLQTEENLVKVLRESVGIQCSLSEDLHRNLQRQLDEGLSSIL